jgi:hypothetical protein
VQSLYSSLIIISELYLNAIQMISKAIKHRSGNLWGFPSCVARTAD